MKGAAFVDRVQISPNHEARANGCRVSLLVLHYTGMKSGQAAVDWLCNPESRVSCHYLVDTDGAVIQMVSEDRRAWHAGVSSWHGAIDINSHSVGIEIQNEGHAAGCPKFPDVQMKAVWRLCIDIMMRHGLAPSDVLAHSDIAPGRKIDPGETFDWRYLALLGVGQLVRAEQKHFLQPQDLQLTSEVITKAQITLRALGYGLESSGVADTRTRLVVEAFQRRYLPSRINGVVDAETLEVMERLLAIQPTAEAFGTV